MRRSHISKTAKAVNLTFRQYKDKETGKATCAFFIRRTPWRIHISDNLLSAYNECESGLISSWCPITKRFKDE